MKQLDGRLMVDPELSVIVEPIYAAISNKSENLINSRLVPLLAQPQVGRKRKDGKNRERVLNISYRGKEDATRLENAANMCYQNPQPECFIRTQSLDDFSYMEVGKRRKKSKLTKLIGNQMLALKLVNDGYSGDHYSHGISSDFDNSYSGGTHPTECISFHEDVSLHNNSKSEEVTPCNNSRVTCGAADVTTCNGYRNTFNAGDYELCNEPIDNSTAEDENACSNPYAMSPTGDVTLYKETITTFSAEDVTAHDELRTSTAENVTQFNENTSTIGNSTKYKESNNTSTAGDVNLQIEGDTLPSSGDVTPFALHTTTSVRFTTDVRMDDESSNVSNAEGNLCTLYDEVSVKSSEDITTLSESSLVPIAKTTCTTLHDERNNKQDAEKSTNGRSVISRRNDFDQRDEFSDKNVDLSSTDLQLNLEDRWENGTRVINLISPLEQASIRLDPSVVVQAGCSRSKCPDLRSIFLKSAESGRTNDASLDIDYDEETYHKDSANEPNVLVESEQSELTASLIQGQVAVENHKSRRGGFDGEGEENISSETLEYKSCSKLQSHVKVLKENFFNDDSCKSMTADDVDWSGKSKTILRGGFDGCIPSDEGLLERYIYCNGDLSVVKEQDSLHLYSRVAEKKEYQDEMNFEMGSLEMQGKCLPLKEACLPIQSKMSEAQVKKEICNSGTLIAHDRIAARSSHEDTIIYPTAVEHAVLSSTEKSGPSLDDRQQYMDQCNGMKKPTEDCISRRKSTLLKTGRAEAAHSVKGRHSSSLDVKLQRTLAAKEKDGYRKIRYRLKKCRTAVSTCKLKKMLKRKHTLCTDASLRRTSLSRLVNTPVKNETHFSTKSLKRKISQALTMPDPLRQVPSKKRKLSIKYDVILRIPSKDRYGLATRNGKISIFSILEELHYDLCRDQPKEYTRGTFIFSILPNHSGRCSEDCPDLNLQNRQESTEDNNSVTSPISITRDNHLLQRLRTVLQDKDQKLKFHTQQVSVIIPVGERLTDNCCIEGPLGKGGFGKVERVRYHNSMDPEAVTHQFAVKKIPLGRVTVADIWIPLTLPTISPDMCIMPICAMESDSVNAYLYMDIAEGGTLEEMLTSGAIRSAIEKMKVFFNLTNAVKHIHYNNIIHGDLKTVNILFLRRDDLSSMRISDFGTAVLGRSDPGPYFRVRTPQFVPPEIVEISSACVVDMDKMKKVDMWQCGTILYRLVFDREIWHEEWQSTIRDEATLISFMKDKGKEVLTRKLMDIPTPYNCESVRDLLAGLLEIDPNTRMNTKQALGILQRQGLLGD